MRKQTQFFQPEQTRANRAREDGDWAACWADWA